VLKPGGNESGRRGAHSQIRFATAECYLGRVLLAATNRGVCAVNFADTDAELTEFLRREFPAATLERDRGSLAAWLAELLRHLAGAVPDADLPLDVLGTAFQRRVWDEMRKIPYGETRSYREVARAIGKPLAARAVARACATNPAMLLIPCHRVIGADGSLRGRGGCVDRRKTMLEAERRE
jgi:AraC family transcriptional regulator of adaptative response/methylated-DNA-[protein]-cysteine methyltransferase